MHDAIITLTTDFGEDSPYVAAMKGVILGINPDARLVDLSHQIPPQDVRHASYFLASSIPFFPPEVIHVVVVDPGVGSDRALLYVQTDEHRLLVPDNGCWTQLMPGTVRPPTVIHLTQPRYWRHPVSDTFHGRDILASVAGHLSKGVDPGELGPLKATWIRLETPEPVLHADGLTGEVVFVDHFGNLITNIADEALAKLAPAKVRIFVGDKEIPRRARTYAEAEPGALVALVSSTGTLEIAVQQGHAARQLHAGVGSRVVVSTKD